MKVTDASAVIANFIFLEDVNIDTATSHVTGTVFVGQGPGLLGTLPAKYENPAAAARRSATPT